MVPVPGGSRGVQVPDDQQSAGGRHPCGNAVVEGQLRHRRMRVVRRHQIEPHGRIPDGQIRFNPPHAVGHLTVGRALGGAGEGFGGDVGCGDTPAV
jgi:hypothetical protein